MNNTAVLKTRFITVPGGSRIFFNCFYCHVSFLSSSNIYWNTLVLSACPFLCSFLVHYSEQTCFGVQMQPEIFLMDCRFLQKAAVFSFFSSSSGFFFFVFFLPVLQCEICTADFQRSGCWVCLLQTICLKYSIRCPVTLPPSLNLFTSFNAKNIPRRFRVVQCLLFFFFVNRWSDCILTSPNLPCHDLDVLE